MTNEPSAPFSSDFDTNLPEVWSSLKDRLGASHSQSRYVVSKATTASSKAVRDLLEAHDVALNRPVSIKQFDPESFSNPKEMDAFVNEARLTGNLQHPNIIPVHDLVPGDDGTLYFTLRYVDGDKLEDLLNHSEAPFSLNEGVTIFAKVCDAIAYAHDNAVFHTAISPDCIIVGTFGEVFVMDWGEAVGGPQQSGRAYNDLTALGPVLRRIAKRAVGDGGKIPLSLEAIIRRLSRPSQTNYPSVDALREDLDRFQAGLPTLAEEASAIRQLVLLVQRHTVEAVALVATAAVAVGMSIWFISGIHHERDRALDAARLAETARQSARESSERKLRHLANLQKLVPMVLEQMTLDMANGQPEEALKRAEIAMELTKDDPVPGLMEEQGDILQTLLRFDHSLAAYETIPVNDENADRLRAKKALSRTFLAKIRHSSATDLVLTELYHEMLAMNRGPEANYLVSRLRERQEDAMKALKTRVVTTGPLEAQSFKVTPKTEVVALLRTGELNVYWSSTDGSVSTFDALGDLPLTSLECRAGNGIASLDALRGRPLRVLNLPDTKVSDLGPLSGLPLTHLQMSSSNVSSLEPLRTVPLKTLTLKRSPYASLGPLADLSLDELDVSGSQVVDLSPLASQQLKDLGLAGTGVRDLSGIDVLRLGRLSIDDTAISDLMPLRQSKLVRLTARKSAITDLSPLADCPLERVDISQTKVTDLAPLRGCPLTSLVIADTAINSLEPVANVASLRQLDMSGLPITELPKNAWDDLRTLIAKDSGLADLSALARAPMHSVDLEGTDVVDLTPIIGKRLYQLRLANTQVVDLSPLAKTNLRYLDLSDTHVTDLRPLASVPLSTLKLSNTPVASLDGLQNMPLEGLDIRGTNVTDLSLLAKVPLKELWLDPNRIATGLSVLKTMPFLVYVHVNGKRYSPGSFPQ